MRPNPQETGDLLLNKSFTENFIFCAVTSKFSVNSYKKICLRKNLKIAVNSRSKFKCDELDKKNYENRL